MNTVSTRDIRKTHVTLFPLIFIAVLLCIPSTILPNTAYAVDTIGHDRLEYITHLFQEDNPSFAQATLRSFAVGTLENWDRDAVCTGQMVSPTVVMTAAHCQMITPGGVNPPVWIVFRTYHNQDMFDFTDDEFMCAWSWAQNSFYASNSDILLFRCEPNALGEKPGDKYGYVDYLDYDLNADGTGSSLNQSAKRPSMWPV